MLYIFDILKQQSTKAVMNFQFITAFVDIIRMLYYNVELKIFFYLNKRKCFKFF